MSAEDCGKPLIEPLPDPGLNCRAVVNPLLFAADCLGDHDERPEARLAPHLDQVLKDAEAAHGELG
eukprot:933855-Prorocentrum_lima.AAC.1